MMRLELAEFLIEKGGLAVEWKNVEAMRGAVSPRTGRRYPLTMISGVFRLARSSVYRALASPRPPAPRGKRGPHTLVSDEALLTEIRAVLATSPSTARGTGRSGPAWPIAGWR